MGVPPENARRELQAFLRDLQDLLEGSLADRPDLFHPHADSLRRAWAEAETRFVVVNSALGGERPAWMDRRKGRLSDKESKELDASLEAHGLTGDSLALKLQLFRVAVEQFLDELALQEEIERYWTVWAARFRGSSQLERFLHSRFVRRLQDYRTAGRERLRGALKWALDAGDVVLDSLTQALSFVPGVGLAAGGIGELKNATEVVLGEPRAADKAVPPPARPSPEVPPTQEGGLPRLRWKYGRMGP